MKYIVKGNFIDTLSRDNFRVFHGALLIEDGIIKEKKEHFDLENVPVYDYGDKLIIPGLTDLHLHAPQYSYAGTAMDLELLDWLNIYTFPEESKYKDLDYAKKSYSYFVNDLKNSFTTRAVIFSSIHTDATLLLMDMLEKEKIPAYVGKVGMDRNCPDYYCEKDGAGETLRYIKECEKRHYEYVYPIITPRFTPSVTDKYMEELGKLAKKYHLAAQSHLSENTNEINWVHELRPNDEFYAESYSKYGLFGKDVKTVMAHCIYSNEKEMKLIKENGVFIAHCPTSNVNVIAGICPAAYYLRNGYLIGLGSDVAGGNTLDLFEVMKTAIQSSKNRYKIMDGSYKPLTISEAFYMASVNGGKFFGKVGLFEEGYEFDCIVLDDSRLKNQMDFSMEERIERMVYLGKTSITAKFIKGSKIV